MNQEREEIRLDLLIKKAVYGLTDAEQRQLDELEESSAGKQDVSFELTASAISLVDVKADEQLPAHLRAKVLTDADRYFSPKSLHETAPSERFGAAEIVQDQLPKVSIWNWLGWAVAAAACIVLVINIYHVGFLDRQVVVTIPPTPTPTLSLAEQREQLLASATDVVTGTWTDADPKQPQNVKGDVVWSNSQQKGFVRFRGLPVNDKTKQTYQLWIVDEGRNPKTPVDGGIFDVNESGETIVPINAKLDIKKPIVFAVTPEKPGGVVMAEGKMIAVAKV